ncbi:MAG TPA: hypothetical protein VG838_03720 [Opitutaceae bacterium]|nr:hypothetical protein [Opitutaceae bacterium]
MKKPTILLSLAVLLAAFGVAGCDTFKSRAREKSEVYDSLAPGTQKRLERGKINPGDTEDMVYIALGDPDDKRDRTTADGTASVWIYRTYWQQYEGQAWAGWHRVIVPTGRGYVIYHEPITEDIYRTHIDEVIRVTFVNGKVTAVEQNKR